MNSNSNSSKYNIVSELQNYMFKEIEQKELIKELTVKELTVKAIKVKEPVKAIKVKEIIKATLPISVPVPVPIPENALYFWSGRNTDTLFWCFYVMKNGISDYEKEPPTFAKEKIEKIKYIQLLRDNKSTLKSHRINKLCDIETNLSLDKRITQHTFFALCALENLNAVILKPQIYADIIANTATTDVRIIQHSNQDLFKLDYDIHNLTNLTYPTTHFKLPLKSIGSYKVCELKDICSKLKIAVLPTYKKQDIYDSIASNLNKIE